MSSFGIDIGAPCCHSLEVLLRVPFRQDLALDPLSPARGLESIKADPDLLDQLHFFKNAVEIRISHRVLCAGCVPRSSSHWVIPDQHPCHGKATLKLTSENGRLSGVRNDD
jgi:hypothetical protein